MNSSRLLLCLSLLLLSFASLANIEETKFDNPQHQQRYATLINELRCLVCQNQNIADSDADLAKDLRRKTATMIKAGKSNQEVRDYMHERYGDFILYRPPFNQQNIVLWLGPIVLLLLAFIVFIRFIKKRPSIEQDATQLARAKALLNQKDHSS